jgi:LPXTG-motif cell wall-anchored protein
VKQSDNQKTAVKDVPGIVGSIFSEGTTLIAGGAGALVGAAGSAFVRKKKES